MLSYKTVLLALLSTSLAAPLPQRLGRRQVPQEHSHEKHLRSVRASLQLNNPAGIVDPVFALLGNAVAAQGAGDIADPDCLQQAVADQAFTNAKEIGDIDAMTDALIFRALERNSLTVGGTTAACTSIEAVNPEIASIQQHQDAASDNAAEINKEITLNLAVQIASIGGDPQLALESGTFAPGEIGDPTAAGNSCNDENDPEGCIFTLGLLVPDATAEEIDAAVAAAGGAAVDDDAADEEEDVADDEEAAVDVPAECVVNNVGDVDEEDVAETPVAAGDIGDFGICSVPQIEFAAGFDGRRETSFRPVDLEDFNHGSAQGVGIITRFVCDQLVNRCGADQTALDTCALAIEEANKEAAKTGAQADAFNAVFGIQTNFADVTPIDDQGREVVARNIPSFRRRAARRHVHPTRAFVRRQNIGDFGSCSVPEIEFGAGFDGRRETSFRPTDLDSFDHGSAQNFDIIGQFVCDQLTNSCGADQAAKDTCQNARDAAAREIAGSGAQADAFNNEFGIQTNFAAIQALDNQGRRVEGIPTSNGNAGNNAAQNPCVQNNGAAANDDAEAEEDNAAEEEVVEEEDNVADGENLQNFAGAIGGIAAPAVTAGGRGFQVANNDSFLNLAAALGRSCDVHKNLCANAANSGADFSVADCDAQNAECRALI